MFSVIGSMLGINFTQTSLQKQVTYISLGLKDIDMESENLSLLIWLSVSDDQKTDSSKDVSVIVIVISSKCWIKEIELASLIYFQSV